MLSIFIKLEYVAGQNFKLQIIMEYVLFSKIIIWYSMDSGNVNSRSTPLSEYRHKSLWPQQITITLTESTLLIFFKSEFEKLQAWPKV